MSEWVGNIVGWSIVGLLLWLLSTIIRFSLISPLRTKGAKQRLRSPDPSGAASVVGFAPPQALVDFYRHSTLIDRQEFTLLDRSTSPPARWPIGGFIPLSAIDTKEAITVSGIRRGIPIADDLDKGVYYVDESGAVILSSPDSPQRHRRVAPDVATFAGFARSE
jgi:hypothetical protein